MKISPEAKKYWDRIPAEFKMKILNNVWCSACKAGVNFNAKEISIEKGMLVIEGSCMICGKTVCRAIE